MNASVLTTALRLAASGLPVLPLRAGKLPVGNCRACRDNACGGRPNMKNPGACTCPAPCHAWAAATTDARVLTSRPWQGAWADAATVAYHPGGAGLTVVDLDNAQAVAWAREALQPTRTVATTRGEHWVYRGAMPSGNRVRPGVDIKSRMAYARWLGPGTGTMADLPEVVRALVRAEEATPSLGGGVASSSRPQAEWGRRVATGCRHTETYVRNGLERGLAMLRANAESGAGSSAFSVARFLASRHNDCPGPCGLEAIAEHVIDAAVSVGVPEPYARRAAVNGLNDARRAAA